MPPLLHHPSTVLHVERVTTQSRVSVSQAENNVHTVLLIRRTRREAEGDGIAIVQKPKTTRLDTRYRCLDRSIVPARPPWCVAPKISTLMLLQPRPLYPRVLKHTCSPLARENPGIGTCPHGDRSAYSFGITKRNNSSEILLVSPRIHIHSVVASFSLGGNLDGRLLGLQPVNMVDPLGNRSGRRGPRRNSRGSL